MQKRSITINPGLLFGIIASLLLHGGLLGVKAFQHPAEARFDCGVVSVELTLLPSIASMATSEPAPIEPAPTEETTEPIVETPTPVPETLEAEIAPPLEQPEAAPETPEPSMQKSVNSIDQNGSPKEDKGTLTTAQTQTQCIPVYPGIARRRGEEGIVVLSVDVSASGEGSNILIVQSSGHSRLDKAAIKALGKARFSPAVQFGKPHASILTQTFNFQLTDAQ